ncbi:hypothetical protein BHC59_11400 [Snodgrassella alvi]|jgi:hypothetical protein|uniref:hypothetical protein n=1 Tax=Snodgrassella alvi TaxID=1196083 RepID=UPI000C1F6072|nr:hypothetical protein [Snodgrassella alvi]PIT55260.1 hypothetical protein BHC59_11400 [Snodgrassella alvi]
MLKRLISLSILAALSISAVTATAADQKHSSVASTLSSKKESQDRELLLLLTPRELRHCMTEYNRCQSGLIPNIAYHQCYAAFRYCQGQNGIFDLPGGAANHHW